MNDFWRTVLGSGLVGAGGGNPAFAFMMAQQQRERDQKQQAAQDFATAMTPRSIPSPTGPNNPAPSFGMTQPNINDALPALARFNPELMVQFIQSQQITPFQRAQLDADVRREGESGRRFDIQQIADAERDVADSTWRSLQLGEQRNRDVNTRNFEREMQAERLANARTVAWINNPTRTGPFAGSAIDAQVMNMLVRGVNDPAFAATPEYNAAYTTAAQPKMQFDAASGTMIPINPDLSWARNPIRAQGPGPMPIPQPAPAQQGNPQSRLPNAPLASNRTPAPPSAPGQPSIGKPIQVTPGRYENTTEFQRKAQQNLAMVDQAAPVIDQYESALSGMSGALNTAGSALSGGVFASDAFKLGQQSGKQFVQSYLYTVTGQSAPASEVDKWYDILMPQVPDSAAVLAQKRVARARALEAIRQSASTGKPLGGDPNAVLKPTGIGQPQSGGWKIERVGD